MPNSRLATGLRTGLVVAAATTGAIVGLGLRHHEAMTPFLLSGRALGVSLTGLLVPAVLATILGVVAHSVWMILWSVCFSAIATPLRGARQAVVSFAVAAVAGLLTRTVLPAALGAGSFMTDTVPQLLFLLAIFAFSLLFGIRLAQK